MRTKAEPDGLEAKEEPMLIAATLTALISIIAIATGLSLLDSWLRGRADLRSLLREKRLLDAGFVAQVEAKEVRLRAPARRTLAAATRPYARRLPLAAIQQAG